MKWYSFSEVVTDATSKFKKIKASDYQTTGKYKIIDQGKEQIAGYTDDANLVNDQLLPIIIFGDHTRALKYEDEPIALGADGVKALLVNSNLAIARYVYYYLRSIQIKEAGYSRHFKFLKEVKIPIPFKDAIPDFEDQKRVAYLLGKVEELIDQRKQHLRQLDELLKSVFLEMFGDPISNPKKFYVRNLSEFYINPREGTKCGPFGGALKKDELVGSGIPVWNMDNIDPSGRMVFPFRMWITEEKYKALTTYSVIDGDIIISRAGTVGKMCVALMSGERAIISTNLIRLRLSSKLRPLYVVSLMTYCKGRVGRLKTGPDGAFTHMNTGILDKLEFPYPPIELQDQFLEIVGKVETLKSYYQQSLTDLESLYGALSQQAFKGELDLSRVPLPSDSLSEYENEQDEAVAPIKSDIPKGIKIKLESLNVFNENATGLKDIARAARALPSDSKQFDIVKQAAAQLAACHSPIEQLKNMPSIASAMEQLESTIKPLNLSQYDSIAKTAELARSMASSISKSDLSWLDQQRNAALKYANAPFESMRSAMEKIESLNYLQADSIAKSIGFTNNLRVSDLHDDALRNSTSASSAIAAFESFQREQLESARRVQSALDYSKIAPKFDTSISRAYRDAQKAMYDPLDIRNAMRSTTSAYEQYLASNSVASYLASTEDYDIPLFYAEDILDVLSNAAEPLSFESLMDQLNELATIDSFGYKTIKAILFDLLAENQIKQIFDPENQNLLFSIAENGAEQ
jgi:restriction endonuclease S subunit